MDPFALSPLAKKLITALDKPFDAVTKDSERVSVDQVVSEVASFYEKIRNAMEYQEEEVVFRSAIERILRRRLFFEGHGEKVAEPLVRELAWAKYFPDNFIPSSLVETIAQRIDLYVKLYQTAIKKYKNIENLYDFFLEIMSSDLAFVINPNKDTQILSNFMFHIFQKKVKIVDDTEENKDTLVYISVKRAFAKEDRAFLRYELFVQYFGRLTQSNFDEVLENFSKGYQKIEETFNNPLNDSVYTFIRRRSIPFIILREVFRENQGDIQRLVRSSDKLSLAVMRVCEKEYQDIHKKARTGVFRSVVFLFATKAIFALVIEGNFEKFFYRHISWATLGINTALPPLIMLSALFFIQTPGRENSLKLLEKIRSLLFDERVGEIEERSFTLHSHRNPFLYSIFILLWISALYLVITRILIILNLLNFNVVSQIVLIFFLILVSFLAFRISQTATVYKVTEEKESLLTLLFDFFFMPIIHLGERLTFTFSNLNVLLIIFDFIIETPFKTLFAFLEQWFSFLRSQRERLE